MSPSNASGQSFTFACGTAAVATLPLVQDEEDLALGCECANPSLQIEAWDADTAAQPSQKFN